MGKAYKKRQKQLEAREPVLPNILAAAKKAHVQKKAEAERFDPYAIIAGYTRYAIRPLNLFTLKTKSRNPAVKIRELLRHAFNKYNPPDFLYSAWSQPAPTLFGSKIKEDYKLWYIALAQGKSLYKEHTMGLLTKKETHFFSTCPFSCSIAEAIWYAILRGLDIDQGTAIRIASTKLSAIPITDWWKNTAKWLADNTTSIKETNDLLDFIKDKHNENASWHLKDFTLAKLRRKMLDWHRALTRVGSMASAFPRWEGIPVDDLVIERGEGNKKLRWRFHQITTGKELAQEGNKQHHCVASYGARCARGECSIWSLTKWDIFDSGWHQLTIEVSRDRSIVQVRGYANRYPSAEELSVTREWAGKSGFSMSLSKYY